MKFGKADKKDIHPEGLWDGTVIGAEATQSKTGRPMIAVQWKTSVGKLRSWITYVEEYPGLFRKPLYALGLTEEYLDGDLELEEVALECLKRRAMLDIGHEDYLGNPTATVVNVSAIPDSGIKPSA